MTNKEALELLFPNIEWENFSGPLFPCLPQIFGTDLPSVDSCQLSSCAECERRWLTSEYEGLAFRKE